MNLIIFEKQGLSNVTLTLHVRLSADIHVNKTFINTLKSGLVGLYNIFYWYDF